MKTFLRTSGLVAALAVASFASARATFSQIGTCRTTCINSTTRTVVSWSSTEADCCSETFNPCPAGSTPTAYSFYPSSGVPVFCGPVRAN
ncbi:MAG TPA: hypothetical protein VIA62_09780 [Thermoanaerobaculia bacterium]|jgi:spermidine/putrescine-binding protein|nr:hypothetical protein [Thermoanaerobaculia bacterium]